MTSTEPTPAAIRPRVPTRRTQKVAEVVARQILQDIRQQGLAPGSKLPPESVMLDRFEIGRGSLREALRILEINGLVSIKTGPGGGPIVGAPDHESFGQVATLHLQALGTTFRELLESRASLEATLAGRAAARPGPEAAASVRLAMAAESAAALDDDSYSNVTKDFHRAIFAAADIPVLALMADSLHSIWTTRVTSVLFPPNERSQVHAQHEDILAAIERHDVLAAETSMREHFEEYQRLCEERYPARLDDVVDWV